MAAPKWVYAFGRRTEGDARRRELLGGKGANLAEMCRLGLPVPPGFTITTEACAWAAAHAGAWPEGLAEQIERALRALERQMGRRFGDPRRPLLLSVRSGAAVSMPGMMDTVLNLGLNPAVVEGLIERAGQVRFAWDAYRRLIHMFGDVVAGIEGAAFERRLDRIKRRRGATLDTELDAEALAEVARAYLALYREATGTPFPEDPREQLERAIGAVFRSWLNPRAIRYRELHAIEGLRGTAVNVQAMVFGNLGERSGTGVAFTRDPASGRNVLYGEYLMNAQGEDVVAGIRTPRPIRALARQDRAAWRELARIRTLLERHYRDMQDLEFTIQDGRLFILQTRRAERTAEAAVRVAVEMAREGLIEREEALARVDPEQLEQLLHPRFEARAERAARVIARGLPASPGAASGRAVFSAATAEAWAARGEPVILVRRETSPDDIGGMHAAAGVLTARGGMTSHAAVVARGMGRCCVAGAGGLEVDERGRRARAGAVRIAEGDWLSLNGTRGTVYAGRLATVESRPGAAFRTLMRWADEARRLGVRANADTPEDAARAVALGAEGIGLCRTEHMFFDGERLVAMREMILAADRAGRERALARLLPIQRSDFVAIFRALRGRPCTIRLLDPPLHEFLPRSRAEQQEMARAMGVALARVRAKVAELSEVNPMLGFRGCRLGLLYPEVSAMQVRAITEAAIEVRRAGARVRPEIMIPLIGGPEEMARARAAAEAVIGEVCAERGVRRGRLAVAIGCMIEVPRAALTAAAIAAHAEFFSFGTNDLTQAGYALSRDDAARFLPGYLEQGLYRHDPFRVIDEPGIGRLVGIAAREGRAQRPGLGLGVCGEHGGEPRSIGFFHRAGLDYVSCSPYRVPVARLAAAQAALAERRAARRAQSL